jgi:hypothetical protein
VIPYLSAISIESDVEEVREIKNGVYSLAAFCNISELMRPVVFNIRVMGYALFIKHSPAILSGVSCLPISSADIRIFSPSLSADVWTPPVLRYNDRTSTNISTEFMIVSGGTLGWLPLNEISGSASKSTPVTPPVQPEVRRQDVGGCAS